MIPKNHTPELLGHVGTYRLLRFSFVIRNGEYAGNYAFIAGGSGLQTCSVRIWNDSTGVPYASMRYKALWESPSMSLPIKFTKRTKLWKTLEGLGVDVKLDLAILKFNDMLPKGFKYEI